MSIDINYSNIANNYDKIINYNTRVRILKEIINKIPIHYSKVLDLACGTGAVIDALPKRKRISIIGVDISKNMLAIAKKRFALMTNVHLRQDDFLRTSFPRSYFDLIIIAHAIRFVPRGKENIFADRVHKWLRKGGVFLVVRREALEIFFLSGVRTVLKKYIQHVSVSPIDNEEGLKKIMEPRFILKDKFQTKIQFWYPSRNLRSIFLPSRIHAYSFLKK